MSLTSLIFLVFFSVVVATLSGRGARHRKIYMLFFNDT